MEDFNEILEKEIAEIEQQYKSLNKNIAQLTIEAYKKQGEHRVLKKILKSLIKE